MTPPSSPQILTLGNELARELDEDGRTYWSEHGRRVAVTLAEVGRWLSRREPDAGAPRVLDVGPGLEAVLLEKLFPGVVIETLGWADHRYRPQHLAAHHPMDLHAVAEPAQCPPPSPCDLVLCLEVIEHLHVAPVHLLRYLHAWLKPGGHLILTTPNAAFLRNRWRLLWGVHPFQRLLEDQTNPGHIRESTRAEMLEFLLTAGFAIETARVENLYDFGSKSGRRFTRLAGLLPAGFRHDLFFIARRPERGEAGV